MNGTTMAGQFQFRPAFLDFETQRIYPSRFADGRLAPFHMLEGLPNELVADRAPSGRAIAAKASLISGFVRNGYFYTRSAAAPNGVPTGIMNRPRDALASDSSSAPKPGNGAHAARATMRCAIVELDLELAEEIVATARSFNA